MIILDEQHPVWNLAPEPEIPGKILERVFVYLRVRWFISIPTGDM